MFRAFHISRVSPNPFYAIRRRRQLHALELIFFVVIVMVPLSFLFISLQNKRIAVQAKKAESAGLLEGLNAIAALNNDRGRAEEALVLLEKASPLAIEVPAKVVPQIRALLKRHALAGDFQATGPHGGGLPGVEIQGTVSGSSDSIIEFVTAIELERVAIQITTLDLSGNGTQFTATIRAVVYTRIES